MQSFYGGPHGQSFAIKTIFNSKVQMDEDLAQGWLSPISVGEYVVISYGLIDDSSYSIYVNEDLSAYGQTYDSTLWQKKYYEDDKTENGLTYKLITSMRGATGAPLNIVANYVIQETENFKNSLDNGVSYIEQNYDGPIAPEDIFGISWVEPETESTTSYWYFKAKDGNWSRVLLTGSFMDFILNEYQEENEEEINDKTYSIHYINSLEKNFKNGILYLKESLEWEDF